MRLHLGCGKRRWQGWVNIDAQDADVCCDIRSLPYEDDSADEIAAIHVFEHFYLKEAPKVLQEWHRVLKPGGWLVLELPCLDSMLNYVLQTKHIDGQMFLWGLYGDPSTHRSELDLHKWAWTRKALQGALEDAGFRTVDFETPQYHVPSRDMRAVAKK